MNKLFAKLSTYVNKYLNTRLVFFIDMCLSLLASLFALVVVEMLSHTNLITIKALSVWMGSSFVFSFLFIMLLRTYRIIIRHTTLKDLAKFVLVAFLKVVVASMIFGLLIGDTTILYMVMVSDFFLTFAFFFVMRVAMLMAYDAVKGKMEHRRKCMNVLVYGV